MSDLDVAWVDVAWAAVFLALAGRFLIRNRKELNGAAVIRHVVFMVLVWAGCVAFLHGDVIVRWVFGREIYKGDPKEAAAGLLWLGAPVLSFAAAAIALGKDRVRQFKLYGETFPVHRLYRRK